MKNILKFVKEESWGSNTGFTLLEILVAITILSSMVISITGAISNALKAKQKIQEQIDDVSHVRDTLRAMERDIHLAFHYRDIEMELEKLIKKQYQPAPIAPGASAVGTGLPANGMNSTQPNLGTVEERREVPRENPETNFIGSDGKIDFVTLNNGRVLRDSRQADFMEVGYYLEECRSLTEDKKSSKCVWRRSSPIVDEDVTKGGDPVVLLENVTEFKFRYFGKGKQDWVSDWRTDGGGDGATKGNFPWAVEISLTTERKYANGKTKKYSFQLVVPIHFPNNSEEGGAGAGSSPEATPTPAPGAGNPAPVQPPPGK